MKLTINAKDLNAVLTDAKRYTKGNRLPVLDCAMLTLAGNTLTVSATDLQFSMIAGVTCKGERDGQAIANIKAVLAALKGAKGAVDVEFNERVLTVAGMSIKAEYTVDSFPTLPTMPDASQSIPLADLSDCITRTRASVSTEESRFTINGARMELGEAGLRMVATDGHRLAHVERPGAYAARKTLVSLFVMGELLKLKGFAGASVEFAEDDKFQYWQFRGRTIVSTKMVGNFPDYERVLPKSTEFSVTLDRVELLAACERALAVHKDDRSKPMRITINGHADLYAMSDLGEFRTTLTSAKYDERPEFYGIFSAEYVADFCRASSSDVVCWRMNPSTNPNVPHVNTAAMLEHVTECYKYVVMPMRP